MTVRAFALIAALGFVFTTATPASAITVEIYFSSNEFVKKGRKAIQQGQLEKAAMYYEKALKSKNQIGKYDMINLRSDLCVAYMYMERFEEALTQCKIGLDLMPNRWETLNNLGTLYLLQGDYENALIIYAKALKMKPKSSVLNQNWEIAIQRSEAAKNLAPVSANDNNKDNPGSPHKDIGADGSVENY